MNRIMIACLIVAVFLISLSGCAPERGTTAANTVEPSATAEAAAATATVTSAPTATAAPQKIVLVAAPGSAESTAQFLTTAAADAGYQLETLPELAAGVLPEMRVVVFAVPPANINELAAANPNTRFVVFSTVDLAPTSNLDVVRLRPESQTFAAGFITTLLSTDWRSAGLLPADSALGGALQEAFVNGGRYYCGVCAPGWPLGLTYPQVAALPTASGGAEWQSAAAGLFDAQKVDLYYAPQEVLQPELVQYLSGLEQFGKRVYVLGTQPPPDALAGQWAGTLTFDSAGALEQIWPAVMSGAAGQAVDAALLLESVNEDVAGEGRQRLIDEMLADLQAGWIYPFSVPLE